MQKLIGRNIFEQSLFVQCDCGEEIVEFCEHNGEYFLRYHSWYDRRLDRYSSFTFSNKGALAEFVDRIRDFTKRIDENTSPITLLDKYLSYKNKLPGALIVDYTDCYVSIRKYPRYDRLNKCTWEVILKREEAKQLVDELDNWR